MQKNPIRKPIEVKISTVVAVSAILHESDPALLQAAMQAMTNGDPDFFNGEFTVIDIGLLDLTRHALEWRALTSLLKSYQLNPVAVRNAPSYMEHEILAHGLIIDVTVGKPRYETLETPEPVQPVAPPAAVEIVPPPTPVAPAPVSTMIIDTPVRAGQRVYARGSDLIITASVNHGAEIIADGSIHVYAPLRGRALAGASGNAEARIFALKMEAELVSIAGIYRTFEEGFPQKNPHPTQIRLVGDRINISAFDPAA